MTKKEIKELWGEHLYGVFGKYIDTDAWLTNDWAQIIEDSLSDWDDDYNDSHVKKETYQKMYNMCFEDNLTSTKIRPCKNG